MRLAVFQPPYPVAGDEAGAEACLAWMREKLNGLEPGKQDLVLLPEYATAPGLSDPQTLREFATSRGADFLRDIEASAKRLECLVALTGIDRSGARWFNRALVFDRAGNRAFAYDKIHLTDVEKLELGLTPGAAPSVFRHAGVRIGFATCFDLYFPEHFAALAAQGADLVLCPSYQRSESAGRLCLQARARALDAGCYLVRASYAMGNPKTGGHSLVAAPDGVLLADAGSEPGVLAAEIDPARKFVKPASHGRPVVEHRALLESHRRPAIYRDRAECARRLSASPFPRLCAHRGLSRACPENTLPAFAAAMAAGAHEIEFDLRTSRDGVPVVCHDESVDRTTNGAGKVADLTWEEISRLDAGVRFGAAWEGIRVPRFEEVLELTDGLVGLNIHIGGIGPDGETIRRVCDLLTERGLMESAYLALGSESSLRIAREYAPEAPRACLARQDDPAESIAIANRYACKRIQFSRQVTAEQIAQAHQAGLVCNLFWSDEPEDARNYVRNGIDVILTNCAHTMIAGGFHPRPSR